MKKILVLEDNPVTLEYITSLIQEIAVKNTIFACSDMKMAYQYALEKDIDLFIIDIILDTSRPGDSSGLKFVDGIRRIDNDILIKHRTLVIKHWNYCWFITICRKI
ncbi:MAG: hypothetical protein J6B96_01680 [Agathobacter sp.]|nr:hypothetical protein [Agathobacter sp.]